MTKPKQFSVLQYFGIIAALVVLMLVFSKISLLDRNAWWAKGAKALAAVCAFGWASMIVNLFFPPKDRRAERREERRQANAALSDEKNSSAE